MSSNATEIEQSDKILVSTICAMTSLISLVVNTNVAIAWIRLKKLSNPFVCLSISLACADCGVLAVFLFMVTPLTYLENRELAFKWPGHIGLIFWFASLYAMLAICINRYVAIVYPSKLKKIFTKKRTKKIIISQWVLAVVHGTLYFIPGCHFVYNPATFGWYYVKTRCYNFMFFLDLVYGVIVGVLIFCFNFRTVIKLHKHNKEMSKKNVTSTHDKEKAEKHKTEARFFFQALFNGIIFEFMLISFHVISRFVHGNFSIFLATGWMWQISHGTNGFLILLFNRKVRDRVFCRNVQIEPMKNAGVQNHPNLVSRM